MTAKIVAVSARIDTYLEQLREAVSETGWTLEPLAQHARMTPSHLSAVLWGSKPLRLAYLVALPEDVQACFAIKRAKACGLMVLEPVRGQQAREYLAAGLYGLIAVEGK
jgi:hypothetical protein